MKRRKALSLLLSLTLLFALALPAATVYADEGGSTKGMEISKTATANSDGSYTITLEAYATGSKVISDITKDIPTDIVLVIDQSGSMEDDIGSVSFRAYTGNNAHNDNLYNNRHNGGSSNLWHRLDDGSHVSVSVTKQEQVSYTQLGSLVNAERWGQASSADCYLYYANNLYEKVGDAYAKVTLTQGGYWPSYTYTYTFSDGTSVTSSGNTSTPDLGSHAPLYAATVDDTQTVYTYTYTDANGVEQTIGTSTGADTTFATTLYQRTTYTTGGGSRLNAIKTAAASFVSAVAAKAAGADGDITTTADNINHRIAVVGFASQSGYGNNTELLSISGWNSGSVGVAYNDITAQNLVDVVQNMDTTAGQTMVNSAINALAANGATRIDLGMDMAERILNANPVSTGEQRNRVVIVFTDGSPTDSNGFEKDVANSAITTSDAIKASGVTVYSIGVFSGADATSAGTEPNGDLGQNSNRMTAACNWFMQRVSSNNGTPQRPSYYLSASDSASLNNIFQQISDQIETGGSSSTLTSEAVVKDIISPQFTLPDGATAADIMLETYACTGKVGSDYTWSKNNTTMGATATVKGDQVSVTGFNFSENYVGTVTENGEVTYRGHKLVISFKVQPKSGFLGGNDVYTNTNAGIYPDGSAETPILEFDKPKVNVPIKAVNVTAEEKNVYLKGEVTADQLKDGATVNVGGIPLDLKKADDTEYPYGLEPWQTEYVDIAVTVRDKDGNVISNKLEDLTDDTTYTIEVTVTPRNTHPSSTQGEEATAVTGSGEGKINVFKPELTFKDSEAYYGADVPAFTDNLPDTTWKHGDTLASSVTMIGTAPDLDLIYTPEADKIANGKINAKQDIAVDVAVKIGNTDVTDKTAFVHTKCAGDTACTDPENGKFWIHVKTCTLTITKTGGANDESYVFVVYKDGQPYSEVTVEGNGSQTIYELPVGTYTIEENTGWSWRYTAQYGASAALTAQTPNGTIICTNTKNANQWLNGFSTVVRNIFGFKH